MKIFKQLAIGFHAFSNSRYGGIARFSLAGVYRFAQHGVNRDPSRKTAGCIQ
jgi:hypothetical protein